MQLDKCLLEKRGCKDYLSRKVPLDILGEILEAGTCAPSAGNLQNWSFIIVDDEEKKEALSLACLNQNWMNKAPIHIVICNDIKKITDVYPTRGRLYATQACSIAAQNIMLKAADVGLHTCWVGAFNEEGVRRVLTIPEDIIPEMVITLGYSDAPHQELVRDPCETVTYFNTYGKREKGDEGMFPLDKHGKDFGKSIQTLAERQHQSGGFFKKLFKKR